MIGDSTTMSALEKFLAIKYNNGHLLESGQVIKLTDNDVQVIMSLAKEHLSKNRTILTG